MAISVIMATRSTIRNPGRLHRISAPPQSLEAYNGQQGDMWDAQKICSPWRVRFLPACFGGCLYDDAQIVAAREPLSFRGEGRVRGETLQHSESVHADSAGVSENPYPPLAPP